MKRIAIRLASALSCAACLGLAHAAEPLTLREAMARALLAVQVDPGAAEYAVRHAAGAVRIAEGAFDWSTGGSAGYTRIYQPGSLGGFLTTEVQTFDVAASTLYAERQLANGVRIRPGLLVADEPQGFRPDFARLGSQPLLQVDIPVDGSLGEPADGLRVEAARSDLEAAVGRRQLARQAHLHRAASAFWELATAEERLLIDRELAGRIASAARRLERLAIAGETASAAADALRTRAALADSLSASRAADVLAARMELSTLLHMPLQELPGAHADFPATENHANHPGATLARLIERALSQRREIRTAVARLQAARLRARIRETELDPRVTFTIGHDRLQLSWYAPLGENRRSGARQQASAEVEAAENELDRARSLVRREVELASARLAAAHRASAPALAAIAAAKARFELIDRLADVGAQPPPALADAAEDLARTRHHWLSVQRAYALALADLRLATGAIPDNASNPEILANLFLSVP